MRAKSIAIDSELEVIDGGAVETTGGAMVGRVRAKLARREGRWRRKMPARHGRTHDGLAPCPEAA